ncbi:MAG TPA: CAP domain-containing protein, partial [Anaeromyxobacter sp.]|nr:CAP domain-containing protein [Anaeromyxobacter sp.]
AVAASPDRGAPLAGQFAPSAAPAPAYGAKTGRCAGGDAFRQVINELQDAAKKSKREPVTADDAVCAVAETFMRWNDQGPPRREVLAFVSQWFGLPAPVLPPSIAVIDTEDSRVIAERVVQAVGNAVVNASHPRLGLATQHARRGATKVVVVLLDAPVEIDPPFPKRLELGQKATLSGKLLGGLRSPEVAVSDAAGQLSTPQQPQGEAFKADVACGDRPGRIVVEIRGQSEERAGVVANLPVACGSQLPTSIALAPEPWPTDPAQAEQKVIENINQERTAAGLAPLKLDPGVAGVARAISEDIASRGGSAGGDVADRMKREGIASPLVLQSASSERSVERAQDRLLASPSNRANIMNREVTNVGVGVVTKPDAEGKPLAYVTEIFTKELPPLDLAKTRDDLRAAVAQKRKDARMTALKDEPLLDDVAQKYAEAIAASGGNLPKEKQSELTAPLTKTMRTLTILSGAKPDPLDFAEEPQVTAVAKSLGVGTAQGKHPVLGRNAVYVVIMVGTPKGGEATQPAKASVKGSRKASGAK